MYVYKLRVRGMLSSCSGHREFQLQTCRQWSESFLTTLKYGSYFDGGLYLVDLLKLRPQPMHHPKELC